MLSITRYKIARLQEDVKREVSTGGAGFVENCAKMPGLCSPGGGITRIGYSTVTISLSSRLWLCRGLGTAFSAG